MKPDPGFTPDRLHRWTGEAEAERDRESDGTGAYRTDPAAARDLDVTVVGAGQTGGYAHYVRARDVRMD